MSDPITEMVRQALAQGWRRDDLILVLADPSSGAGSRMREMGVAEVGGVCIAVMPRKNFDPAFADAPAAVKEALLDKAKAGTVHAVQIDEQNAWSIGSLTVPD